MFNKFTAVGGILLIISSGFGQEHAVNSTKSSPFAVSPREAFAILAELKVVSGKQFAPTADEVALFVDAAGGKLGKFNIAEAALLASGVTDAAKRKDYLARIDAIEADAKKAVADSKSPRERGERLLKFLHAGPMSGGYHAQATTLADILEQKKFNCVSSALLYNLIGSRLGLDLRAIEIPGSFLSGHVFSVMRADGKLIDIETTNKLGFNPSGKRERPDGVEYDPKKRDTSKREIGDLALVAVVYYNRGVVAAQDKRWHEAAFLNLCALCLDSGNPSAAKNVLAELVNWGPKLADEGKFEEGLRVLAVGLKLAPKETALLNNYNVVWVRYAESAMEAGKDDEALKIAQRAQAATKSSDSAIVKLPVHLYLKPSEAFAKLGKWDEGFALAQRGVAKLDAKSAAELRDWQRGLFLRAAASKHKQGDWTGTFDVLEKGVADDPKDTRCRNQIVYYAQEWLADTKGDLAKATERVGVLRKRFPDLKDIQKVVDTHVARIVDSAIKAEKYEQAVTDLSARHALLADAKRERELGVNIYLRWAKALEKKDWKEALAVLAKGEKAYAKEANFESMARAVCDGAGFAFIRAKEWAKALPIYEEGLKQFPASDFLKKRVELCRTEGKK